MYIKVQSYISGEEHITATRFKGLKHKPVDVFRIFPKPDYRIGSTDKLVCDESNKGLIQLKDRGNTRKLLITI